MIFYGCVEWRGQKQRIAITRVLLEKAEVIIFDEPTSGLDYENKMRIKNLIYDLGEKTVILITHDKDLIESEGYLNIFTTLQLYK